MIAFDSRRIPFYLTFAAVLAALAANRACNLLIGAALGALLIERYRGRQALAFPPIKLPLALFFGATVVSVATSGHMLEGWPGVRKFYLFFILLLVVSTFRRLAEVRALVIALTGVMTLSALWSLFQFWRKMQQAQALHEDFYHYYTGERITGFMSHWMTLGGEEMMVILMAVALLFFGKTQKLPRWMLPGLGIILLSLLFGYTRSMWLGTAIGGLYLVWFWKRWLVLLAPVPLALLLVLNPAGVGERIRSVFQPHGDTDSNQFRVVCRRTGWEMIKAHPWLGLGPEQVKAQFKAYIPADIPRPLPSGWYGHLHNVYLHYAAERGVPAAIVFLWLLGKMLLDFVRALRQTPATDGDRRYILHGAIAVMLGVLAAAFYEHNLGDGEVLTVFLAVCGCGYLAMGIDTCPRGTACVEGSQ